MLYTQYTCTKQRNAKTWEKFRQQRHLVTKLKKKSMKNNFLERCSEVPKLVIFRQLLNLSFLKKKCNFGEQKTILCENNKIINDAKEASENFNSFFSTVADKIRHNVVYDPSTHPSIVEINNHVDIDNNFDYLSVLCLKVTIYQFCRKQLRKLANLLMHSQCAPSEPISSSRKTRKLTVCRFI